MRTRNPQRNKGYRFFFLGLFLFFLTGCWGSREIDEASYALAIGIDQGEKGEIALSLAVLDPLPIGGAVTAEERVTVRLITVTGPSLFSALNLANNLLARPVNLTHLKLLVFGQDLARKGLGRHLDAFIRWREFRRTVYLAVAADEAVSVLQALARQKEDPAKYVEMAFMNQGTTGLAPLSAQFLRFYNEVRTKTESPLMAMALPTAQGKSPPQGSEAPFRLAGAAVFKEGRMVGRLDLMETVLASLLRGDLKQTFLTIPFPGAPPHKMDLRVIPARKPELSVRREKKGVRLGVKLFLRGEVVNVERVPGAQAPVSPSAAEKVFRQWMEEKCHQLLAKAQAWRTDFIGFAYKARWLVPDWPAWTHWDWEAAFATAPIDLQVEVKIDRTGLILEKHNVREE